MAAPRRPGAALALLPTLALALALLAGCGDDGGPARDADGSVTEEGELGAFSLEVGDCFDNPAELAAGETSEIFEVPALPCDQPHDNQVFALVELGDAEEYPGQEAVQDEGHQLCLDEFEGYVGVDHEESELEVLAYLFPTAESWEDDDREVVCVLHDAELGKLEGPLAGAER